jgi:predicted transcriptional regulator
MPAKKWSDIRSARFDAAKRAELDRIINSELLEMSLAELRKELGKTQAEVAAAAEMTQGMLSQVENRDDHLVSTLRRCVRALGGDLELTAVVGNKRVKLSF